MRTYKDIVNKIIAENKKTNDRYSVRGEAPDFSSDVEIQTQREQVRTLLNGADKWRNARTVLDSRALRKSTETMLKQFGDKLTRDQQENYVSRIKNLAYDIIRNGVTTEQIESTATKIAGDILFESRNITDTESKIAFLADDQAEQAIDYLTNYVLANVINTQTNETSAALKETQRQIEKNEKLKDTLRRVRQRRDENIRRGIESRKAQRREQTDSKLRESILNRAKRLEKMKMSQPNKALLKELIGNMNTDVTHLTDGQVKKLENLLAWIAEKEASKDEDFYVSDSLKKKLMPLNQDYIDDIIQKNDPDAIRKLRELNDALMELEHMVRTQHKILSDIDKRDTREIASAEADNIRHTTGTKEGVFRKMDTLIVQGTLSPMRFWHRLTGYNPNSVLYKIAKAIDEGGIKKIDFEMRASKKFDPWMSNKGLTKKWVGKKADIITYDTHTATGEETTISLTPGMRMTLYLASQDNDWMRHMCGYDTPDRHVDGGGITLPKMDSYKKGNLEEAYDGASTVRITKSFLTRMIADMSAEEKEFANEVHDFFNVMQKEELNAVSQILNGVDMAKEDDYLPISVDKRFLGTDYGAIKNDGTVEGAGAFKERVDSGAPVVVRDLTDILLQSINTASSYIGYAIPIRDMNKVMKATIGYFDETDTYRTHEEAIRYAISQKWGNTALSYIDKAMSDIQNPSYVREDLEKAFQKLRSNYARSVLVLNASVGLKQAASYPTAAAVVGYGPLAKALVDRGKIDTDLIRKYTPLLAYRSKGFINPELGSIKGQNDIWNNLPTGLNWITGIDYLTTKRLWRAAEYYVRDNQPGLYQKGAGIYGQSDAYNQAVAEVYNRIIEETQPNYTPWQRPQYLRSQSGVVQTLMMFKTQPMQNFNVLYDAIGNYRAQVRAVKIAGNDPQVQARLKDARKNLGHAISSQLGQLVTFAAMTMAWNLFRRKKEKYTDDEGNFSLEVLAQNMGKDIGSGIFGMFPFGSDAWALLSSLAFGDKYYGFESVTDSALNDLGEAVRKAWQVGGELLSSITSGEPFDLTAQKKRIKSVAFAVSKIFGIPAENIYNLLTALYKRGRDIFDDPHMADYYALAWDEDPANQKKAFTNILYQAFLDEDSDAYDTLRQTMIDSGVFATESKINDYMEKNPDATRDEAIAAASEKYIDKAIEDYQKGETANGLTFADQERYDSIIDELHESSVYQSASDEEQDTLEDYAMKLTTASNAEWRRGKEAVDQGVMSASDYLAFRLALDQVDVPTDSGKYGTYTKEEQQEAIKAMGWTDAQAKIYWEFLPKGDAKNPYDAEQKKTNSTKKKEPEKTPEETAASVEAANKVIQQAKASSGNTSKKEKGSSYLDKLSDIEGKQEENKKAKMINETVGVNSSWIGSIGYNEETGTLYMTTKAGRSYTRTGVSKEQYLEFKNSGSKGSYWNSHF